MRQVFRLFIVFFLVAFNGFLVQNISAQSISLERNKASLFSGNSIGFADGSALSAQFNLPTGIAPDTFGNIYIADYSNHSIRKINALGVVTTIAGNGTSGFADGQDTAARFNGPTGITCDLAGNIYVADQMNNRIRKITPTGLVSTYAGDGFIGALDGPASSARFNFPIGIACDTAGNLFVADQYNHKIRKINAAGIVSTLCGDGVSGFVNGTGLVSRFSMPTGIAVDLAGNVFVADYGNHSIRKVTSTGQSSTYAGTGASGYKDTLSIFSQFSTPSGLFCDMNGDVIVADRSNQKIRRISPNGIVSTIAGSFWGSANGIGSAAQFANPYSLSKNINGDFIIADGGNNQIRRLSAISLDSFFATIYGFSAPKNISIRGVGLSGNLKVFAPTGFQVSLLSGAGYADSLELTPISGEITQELYFRLQSNTSGVYSGDVIVSSPSSTTLQIPLKGRVNCAIVGAVSPGGSSTTNYNQPTSIQFSQSGLFAPTWSTTGSLPTGISMNSATGEISGSPTQTGTFNFIVLASAGGCNLSNAYSLFVNGTPTALFNHIANSCANRNVQFTDSSVLDTSWLWNFGDGTFSTIQNPLHTYASDSVYTVTLQINGASGPQTSKQISVATTPTTPTISSSNSCNYVYTFSGAPTGYGYRYAWSFAPGSSGNGDTIRIPNRTYASSGPTTVNLTVSAQGSCSVSAAPFVFMANQNTVGVTAAMSLTGDICSNQRTLSNTSSGSGTVFSYSLDGSAYATITGSQLLSSLSGGVHLVKLAAHDNSCFDTTSTSFTLSSVVVNFSSDSNTCNQIVNFSNSSSVSFGSASYLWQFGVPVKDSSTLTNPSYDFVSKLSDSTTLRITAASGCVATLRKATAVGQGTAPVPNFDIILDSNYCSNRYRFLNTTANTSGVSYVWDFGNGNGSTLANPIHSYGDTGVYLVKLNVTSAACVNPIVKTKVLPIPYGTNWPNPFFTTNNNVQNFATQNFNFNNTSTYVGSGYIMRYFWDFGDGTYDSTHTSIYGKTYAAAGIYTVTLRAQSWQGCFNQYSQTVEVTPMLTAKFGYTQNLCVDRVINFKDSSTLATSYFWNFGDGDTSTLQNPVHVFRKDSVYTVTLQVNGGPIFTKTITVSIAPPVPSLTYSNTCNFDYTFLGAPAGNFYRYAWNFDAGSSGNGDTVQIPNRRYSFNGSTTVQLTVFSLGNCLSVSSPLVFTASQYKVGVNADFTLTGDVCSNQRLLTNASTGSGSVFSISYDGLPFINYTIPVLISSLTSGRHDFVFAAHDSSCFDTAYSSVVVSNVVVNFKSDSNTCNQQVAFTNQSVVAFGTAKYLWEFGSPIKDTSTQTNPVFNFQSATVDSTTLTVLAESGCTASLKKVTAVGAGLMPNPQILVTRDPGLCSNNFRFSNISTYHPTATYTWSFGDGSFSNDSSIIHTYADTGFYQVELRSSSPNCAQPIIATSSANVPSTVNFPIPNFTINNDTQTYTNQNFQLLNTSIFRGPGFITNYYWNFSDGSYDSVNTSLYSKTFGQPGIYTITLSAKSWLGCINQISQKVVVTPVVISKFGYSGNTCSSRTVSFRDSSSLAAKYKWYFGDGDTSILPNPVHTYSKDSIYRVYLVINDTVYSTQLLTVATTPVLTSVVALKDCGNKYTLAGAPGGYGLNYAWNLGGGLGSDSTFQIPVVYYNSGGLKTVSVSVNSYGLCPISSSLHSFTAQPISTANIARLSLSAPGSDFCTNDRILTNNSNPGSTYTYNIDNGVFAPIATSISLNGLATGYHSVKVKAENGSCVDIAEKGFFISTPTASFV
jgi:PKD repeat protein